MPASRGTPSKRRGGRGFSLIELVAVVAVTGVLAAVAIPRFAAGNARYRVEAAANRIVADLGIAAATSAASARHRDIVFDVGGDTYVMLNIASGGRTTHRWHNLSGPPYSANILRASFGPNLAVHRTDAAGAAEEDGVIVVSVGRYGRRIVVTAGSSAIAIEDLTFTDAPDADALPPVERQSSAVSVDAMSSQPGAVLTSPAGFRR
ncbi:MAG: prepilin-type N-terminal cleavage/methylation domain-containing protein [Planctomycetota bacterium]